MLKNLISDLKAVHTNDPAAKNYIETFFCHTPLHAIILHRISHFFHARLRIPIFPRLVSVFARWWTGVEIHPGAKIGKSFFIDHGMGVVIGETSVIGDNCVMFHNVTMGGTGKHHGKRHPTIKNNVFIGTAAIMLGPITVGENARIGANSFIIMHDVPANSTVVGTPARIVKLDGKRVDQEMSPTEISEESIPVAISNEISIANPEGSTRAAIG